MASLSFNPFAMASRHDALNQETLISPVRVLRTTGKVNHIGVSNYTLINTAKEQSEIVLDYGRAEGGIPVFEVARASGTAPISVRVVYSETIDGIDSETGK